MDFAQTLNRQLLLAKKESPHIFFGIGVLSAVTSTVLACRATLRLNETLDEIEVDVHNLRELKHSSVAVDVVNEDGSTTRYPIEQIRKDTFLVYSKAGMKIVKLYGPAFLVGVAAIGFLTGAHVQLHRRNAALMAAYAAVQKAYDEYRERVREELGEEKELDIYHAAKTQVMQGEDGKNHRVKVVDAEKLSPYARFFDENSQHWKKEPEFNQMYVRCQQKYANDLLTTRGHVFLNDVYDMFDIERTPAGAVVGWVKDGDGDNHIDFGLYEARNAAFLEGYERNILLDFNVDGVIYDKI